MKKILFVILFVLFFSSSIKAENVFADINFEKTNEIYRIKTEDESIYPVGLAYLNEHSSLAYFIDIINNHRFIYKKVGVNEDYKTLSNNICRQVFDGSPKEADRGRQGNPSCFDSRDEVISGEKGKLIYRPVSVAFSGGLGNKIEESKALKELALNECEVINNKNWYSIPNGSWYQTWFAASSPTNISYDIFYDRWEEKYDYFIEEIWRGDSLYKAFERNAALLSSKRLLRAKVDGALEKFEDSELKLVMELPYKTSFFMLPGRINKESKFGCYYWYGNDSGQFFISGSKTSIQPIYESKDADNRFACYGTAITGVRKYYILGTDILKQWLKNYGFPNEKAECSNVAFVALENSLKSMIYIYSRPENCLYRFIINEEKSVEIGLPKKINVDFKIAAMTVSEKGSLYITPEIIVKPKPELDNMEGIEMETSVVTYQDNNASIKKSLEKIEDKDWNSDSDEAFNARSQMLNLLTCDADCLLILSRAYYQHFYELPFGNDKFDKLDYELFVGKEFFSCKLSFKNISVGKLNGNLESLMFESKKPGNHANQIEYGAPGYVNSLRIPKRIYLAVQRKN